MNMMKAKTKKASKPVKKKAKRSAKTSGGRWRLEDLPISQQVELKKRMEKTENGEGLLDFDEALKKADQLTEEILSLVDSSSEKHKPVE